MKTLVVGGTGMIGAHAAGHLAEQGHDVTVGGRTPPAEGSEVARYPFLAGDYADGGLAEAELEPFEAVVFAAGSDVRHVRDGVADDAYWRKYQVDGVPEFFARAKRAGVRAAVQVGSYYHMVRPDMVESNPYVRARQLADDRSRELADRDFAITTLNPPSIVGMVPGPTTRQFAKLVSWARGDVPEVPPFAPPGGGNYMTARSLAEAIEGALERGEPGRAYLVGDENLTFQEYFQVVYDAAGAGREVEVRDENCKFMPDRMIVQGRGNFMTYDIDPDVVSTLGYRRQDIRPMIEQMVDRLGQ